MRFDSYCPFKDFIQISTKAGAEMFIKKLLSWNLPSFIKGGVGHSKN